MMSGGTLMCGSSNNDTTLFFVRLGDGDAYFWICDVDLRFASEMYSVVHVTGGTVRFERVKIDRQYNDRWVNPLIEVDSTTSAVTISFVLYNVTNFS
jgi:hypothetical protein